MSRSRYDKRQVAGRTVSEHRHVWEQANGPIPDGYVIHHINGNALDNRLENLAMLTSAEHTRLHRLKHPKVKTCVICAAEYVPHETRRASQQTCSPECKRALLSKRASERPLKTHCVHGHPFDEANTYIRPTGQQACRACRTEADRRSKERRKAS